jgi:phage regulator Rha-like protein
MEAIRNLDCSDDFRESNFRTSTYTSLQNKELPCYEISRDGFAFLAMGFVGVKAAEWKEKYIVAFNQMESALNESIKKPILKMEDLNAIAKRIDQLNEVGSFHGAGLASFKKKKRVENEVFKLALDSAQLVLNIK